MQNRSDWKNHAGGEEDWSSTSSSMREVPYQQQKIFQKPVPANRFQYGQNENERLYRRWHAAAAEKQAYAARRVPIYAAATDGGYYRRYSLDAPPPPPESLNYYNNKRSAAFIGQPLEDDINETPSTLSNQMLYPQAIDFGFISSDNVRSEFYFNQNTSTQFAGTSADVKIINTEQVVHNLTLFGRFLEVMQSWPLPHVSFTTACILVLLATFISPRLWTENIIFPAFRLSFGTLYPAYASYKAVRTKNVKEYVKWMMYWIVYAFFTCIETFTDIFLAWFPFYYEVKVIIVLWLLSPATKGSSTLYRKFVHPMLTRREQEIDEYLNQAKERGYSAVLQLGTKGVNYATNVIMQTALKGGGNLVQTIRRSYSLSDLSEPDVHRTQDEIDDVVHMRTHQRMLRPRPQAGGIARSASGTRHSTGMYFSEVDVVKGADGFNYNIRSSEDISSGYSSAEPVSAGLSRTSSMTNASKARLKGTRRTDVFNESQKFITPEQNFYSRNQFPMAGFRHFEYEKEFDDSEVLEDNPTAFDVPKCIKVLKEIPTEGLEDDNATEAPQSKMETNENTDVDAIRRIENVEKRDEKGTNKEKAASEGGAMQDEQQEFELTTVQGNLTFNTTIGDMNELPLMDEANDNNSICSNADTFNSLRINDEDNESDEFSDALPSLADDEEELDYTERNATSMVKSADIHDVTQASVILNIPKSSTELNESLPDIKQIADPTVDTQKTENFKVTCKELQDTLQEIKDNFRATIVSDTRTPTTALPSSIIDNRALISRTLTHKKGKAPAPPPPLPPRPAHPTSTNIVSSTSAASSNSALDAVSSSSRSPSPGPSSKGIFKNLKTNLFRFGSNTSVSDKQLDGNLEKTPFETQL